MAPVMLLDLDSDAIKVRGFAGLHPRHFLLLHRGAGAAYNIPSGMALVLDGLGATPWVLALLYLFAMVFISKYAGPLRGPVPCICL